jgi:hypothetical protein
MPSTQLPRRGGFYRTAGLLPHIPIKFTSPLDEATVTKETTMPRDFYPRADAQVLEFTRNMSVRVSADPQAYGFSDQIAADYAAVQQAFAQAFAATSANGTNCSTAYQVKKDAAVALEQATRSLARQMKADPDVSAVLLQNVALSRTGPRRNHVQVPSDPPVMQIVDQRGSTLTLTVFESGSTRRGLPRDVSSVSICGFVGDQPAVNIKDFFQMRESSRANRVTVQFSQQLPLGTKVWLTARWRNARGEAGPGCAPVYAYLGLSVPLPGANLRAAA